MPDGNTILSVAKAMELLTALSKAGQPLTLKELSERCGFPKSTVFGLLTTMREYDVISQTPDGKYTLGLRLFEFGCQVEQSWDISSVARPYMEHLAQRTGASVVLSICESAASLRSIRSSRAAICTWYPMSARAFRSTAPRRARSSSRI